MAADSFGPFLLETQNPKHLCFSVVKAYCVAPLECIRAIHQAAGRRSRSSFDQQRGLVWHEFKTVGAGRHDPRFQHGIH